MNRNYPDREPAAAVLIDAGQRAEIARHADRLASDRAYRLLAERAAQANAEYRFRDLMDRHVLWVVLSLLLAVAVYGGLAQVAFRSAVIHGESVLAASIGTAAWTGMFLLLPAWLAGVVLFLRRKVMGERWWRDEVPRYSSRRHVPLAGWGGAATGCAAALAAGVGAWLSPLVLLVSLDFGFVALIAFVVYSELASRC